VLIVATRTIVGTASTVIVVGTASAAIIVRAASAAIIVRAASAAIIVRAASTAIIVRGRVRPTAAIVVATGSGITATTFEGDRNLAVVQRGIVEGANSVLSFVGRAILDDTAA
jgi:hypothetical protein